jgi:hypothetical protein
MSWTAEAWWVSEATHTRSPFTRRSTSVSTFHSKAGSTEIRPEEQNEGMDKEAAGFLGEPLKRNVLDRRGVVGVRGDSHSISLSSPIYGVRMEVPRYLHLPRNGRLHRSGRLQRIYLVRWHPIRGEETDDAGFLGEPLKRNVLDRRGVVGVRGDSHS